MSNPSEYQVEYGGQSGGKIGMSDGGFEATGGKTGGSGKPKSLEEQPVGGRAQNRARTAAMAEAAARSGRGLPCVDSDFVAQVYSESERGTHRVAPQWHDPRWSDARRADSSTLYEPSQRDPPNRNNFYVYRTTAIDAFNTPAKPLTVPDVHKLRYMSNTYMTPDDWY